MLMKAAHRWECLFLLFIPYVFGSLVFRYILPFPLLPTGPFAAFLFVLIVFSSASLYRRLTIPLVFFILGAFSAVFFSDLSTVHDPSARFLCALPYFPWFPAFFLSAFLSLSLGCNGFSRNERAKNSDLRSCLTVSALQCALFVSSAAVSAFIQTFDR